MTHEDNVQRAAFCAVNKAHRQLNNFASFSVQVEEMSAFQVEVPTVLESYLRQMMIKYQIDPQFNHIHTTSREGTVTLSLDHTIDDCQVEFQLALIKDGTPMSIYMNTDDDLWKRSEFRWIDDKYQVCKLNHMNDFVDLQIVIDAFNNNTLDQLKEAVLNQEIISCPVPFYDADIAYCKPMALKAICGSM